MRIAVRCLAVVYSLAQHIGAGMVTHSDTGQLLDPLDGIERIGCIYSRALLMPDCR